MAGIARLHAMIAEHLGEDADEAEVLVGIETERGPWVAALLAAGYTVYAVNPLQAARYRERHSVSGAKSDSADAHVLADMVRTDAHLPRSVAADSSQVQAIDAADTLQLLTKAPRQCMRAAVMSCVLPGVTSLDHTRTPRGRPVSGTLPP